MSVGNLVRSQTRPFSDPTVGRDVPPNLFVFKFDNPGLAVKTTRVMSSIV